MGLGGLETTAWRSSSLDAGLADLEAMSAARQRPLSQLLLCFMSGNAFRRRVKFFVRPSAFAAAGVPGGVEGALCALRGQRSARERQLSRKAAPMDQNILSGRRQRFAFRELARKVPSVVRAQWMRRCDHSCNSLASRAGQNTRWADKA